jgi:hypothetical protein
MSSMTSEQRAADRLLAGDQIRLAYSVMAGHRRRLGRGVSASGGRSRRSRLVRLTAVRPTIDTALNSSGGWRTS